MLGLEKSTTTLRFFVYGGNAFPFFNSLINAVCAYSFFKYIFIKPGPAISNLETRVDSPTSDIILFATSIGFEEMPMKTGKLCHEYA